MRALFYPFLSKKNGIIRHFFCQKSRYTLLWISINIRGLIHPASLLLYYRSNCRVLNPNQILFLVKKQLMGAHKPNKPFSSSSGSPRIDKVFQSFIVKMHFNTYSVKRHSFLKTWLFVTCRSPGASYSGLFFKGKKPYGSILTLRPIYYVVPAHA